jgi:hypothetical protein
MRDYSGNKTQHTTREVHVMFEPSRLAQNWLHQAYERVVPISLQRQMHSAGCKTSSSHVFEGSKRGEEGSKR